MRYEQEIEELFAAVMDHRCESRYDIADITGWNVGKVSTVLAVLRRPEIAEEWGWTVPHVPRGVGEHLYQVVEVEGPVLGEDEMQFLREGASSTLALTATQNENQAHALRLAAQAAPTPAESRVLRRVATASEGLAAMAADAAELIGA